MINKSGDNYGLEKLVDYYFNLNKSFMVGYPPQDVLETKKYSIPYVYVDTSIGICENWLPFTGITDHVGGIYNSFVISSQITKLLNDAEFDISTLKFSDSEPYYTFRVCKNQSK